MVVRRSAQSHSNAPKSEAQPGAARLFDLPFVDVVVGVGEGVLVAVCVLVGVDVGVGVGVESSPPKSNTPPSSSAVGVGVGVGVGVDVGVGVGVEVDVLPNDPFRGVGVGVAVESLPPQENPPPPLWFDVVVPGVVPVDPPPPLPPEVGVAAPWFDPSVFVAPPPFADVGVSVAPTDGGSGATEPPPPIPMTTATPATNRSVPARNRRSCPGALAEAPPSGSASAVEPCSLLPGSPPL